jgi:hypothetical protein
MKISEQERKITLDSLLAKYKAQPVGYGYIDVIVMRENYKDFAKELIANGFEISAISWWEYVDSVGKPSSYGMGGPSSWFYSGWFAEVGIDIDDLPTKDVSKNKLSIIVDVVENKVLGEIDGNLINYKNSPSLMPAFWIKVNKDWKNVRSCPDIDDDDSNLHTAC